MYRGVCNFKFLNEFCFCIRFYMVFVPVKSVVVFLCPPGIDIFLAKLVWLFLPISGGCPGFFDMFVFFAGIPLAWGFNKTGIDHFSLIGKNPCCIKSFVEYVEQNHDHIFFYQLFAEVPERFAVRYFVALF